MALSAAERDGTLDPSFGGDGRVVADPTGEGWSLSPQLHRVLIQSDGKILALGHVHPGVSADRLALVRFLADGTADSSFGIGGAVIEQNVGPMLVSNNGPGWRTGGLALQPDGKILAAGELGDPLFDSNFAVLRYDANGNRDQTFGTGGLVTTSVDYHNNAVAVAVRPNGNIVVAGRLNPDWTLYPNVRGPCGQGNGRITNGCLAVVQYLPNGTIDSAFGDLGVARFPWPATDCYTASSGPDNGGYKCFDLHDMALQSDGAIVLTGTAWDIAPDNYSLTSIFLMRFTSNGSVDSTFGQGGRVLRWQQEGLPQSGAHSLVIQPDQKITAAGGVGGDFAAFRYLASGEPDTNFGVDGLSAIDLGSNDAAFGITIDGGGRVVLAGSSGLDDKQYFGLARLNSDGSLDASFGADDTGLPNDGRVHTRFYFFDSPESPGAFPTAARSVAIQPDGRIVAAGFGPGFALARYTGSVPELMTGRAFGISLDSPVKLKPTPDTGNVSTAQAGSTSTPCVIAEPAPAAETVLCAAVTTAVNPSGSTASAYVADLTLAIGPAVAIQTRLVEARSHTTCGGSKGETTIAFLKINNKIVIGSETQPAPNKTVQFGAGRAILNEQLPVVGADKGLTVNAIHLVVPGLLDLIVSSATSDIHGCP